MTGKSLNGAKAQLLADKLEFERSLDVALNWPRSKPVRIDWVYDKKENIYRRVPKYGRRPPKWKSRHGYEFVSRILTIQARDNCSVADAIRKMKRADARKWPESQRDLARRFDEIKDYWRPWYLWRAMLDARQRELRAKPASPRLADIGNW
jgi:hypothetical protein